MSTLICKRQGQSDFEGGQMVQNPNIYNGFGMDSNRQPLLVSDVLLFCDASFGCVSKLQHLGNVKMLL